MFFFLITKEFERISFSITGEDQTKYSFPLSLFLGVLLFFWRTSFENYLLLSLFLMYFVIIYLRYFNRKNAVIPAISFLLVDSLLVFSNGVLNFEDPLLYLVLLQPFFFLSIFNLTKGINEKNSVLYYISNAFFLVFYVIVMFYAYNPDDLNLFLSNVFKLIIAFTLYIFFQFLMIFLINRFYNYVFEKDYVYQQNEFGYYTTEKINKRVQLQEDVLVEEGPKRQKKEHATDVAVDAVTTALDLQKRPRLEAC